MGIENPDFEDEKVRLRKMPRDSEEGKKIEETLRERGVKIDMGEGKTFIFNPSYIVFADKEKTIPVYAFKLKHEEKLVLYVKLPENAPKDQDIEDMHEKTMEFWEGRFGYSSQNIRDVIQHVMDKEEEISHGS